MHVAASCNQRTLFTSCLQKCQLCVIRCQGERRCLGRLTLVAPWTVAVLRYELQQSLSLAWELCEASCSIDLCKRHPLNSIMKTL